MLKTEWAAIERELTPCVAGKADIKYCGNLTNFPEGQHWHRKDIDPDYDKDCNLALTISPFPANKPCVDLIVEKMEELGYIVQSPTTNYYFNGAPTLKIQFKRSNTTSLHLLDTEDEI